MSERIGAWFEVYDGSSDHAPTHGRWLAGRLAELRARPGAVRVQCWRATSDDPVTVSSCDLRSASTAQDPAWVAESASGGGDPKLRIRYAGEQILPGSLLGPEEAKGLLLLAMNVDPKVEAEFNEWNDTEHFVRLARVPGVLAARRFRCASGTQRYLAVYHTTAPEVIDSPGWVAARETPWTHRIRTYTSARMRVVCRRVTDFG